MLKILHFKLALRELFRNWRWSLFFSLNLCLGLSGFMALLAFTSSLAEYQQSNAKKILAADIAISARRYLTAEEITNIRQIVGSEAQESELVDFFAMAQNQQKRSNLVLIKAVDDNYPLYGQIYLQNSAPTRLDAKQADAWAYQDLKYALGVEAGEKIKIGNLDFVIQDFITTDDTQTFRSAFIAPRVYIHKNFLKQTGLIQYGSTFSHSLLYKLPENVSSSMLRTQLLNKLTDPAVSIDTYETAGEDSGRQLNYLTDYLGLVAIVALCLSGLGAAYIYRSYLQRRTKEIATYRVLGLQSAEAIFIYLLQMVLLGIFSLVPSLLFTQMLLPILSGFLSQLTPFSLSPAITSESVLLCFALILLVNFLVSLPFLMQIHALQPAKLFSEVPFSGILNARFISFIPAIVVIWILAVWQAHSVRTGSYFIGMLLLVILVLFAVGYGALKKLPDLKKPWYFKYALLSLRHRPASTLASFIALGIGSLLINILPQLKTSLQKELNVGNQSKLPSLFMFDIQEDQMLPLENLIRSHNIDLVGKSPMIRARILKVNDDDFERKLEDSQIRTREEEREARFRNRGVNLSYRENLSEAESIVEGKPFSGAYDESSRRPGEVSIEYKYAERLGLKLGDKLTFDIQGVQVVGEIINFRKVSWTSFQPNFFILLQNGWIADAPKTFLASLPSMPIEQKQNLQSQMAEKFPNISMIDVKKMVTDLLKIAEQMSWSLELMALLALITGYIVLFSIINIQLRQRRWELNMLKVLGAEAREVQKYIISEFLLISFLASSVGALLSLGVSYSLMRYIFDGAWEVQLGWVFSSVFCILLLSYLISRAAVKKVVEEAPLVLLRNA